jgi:hypothetical protein
LKRTPQAVPIVFARVGSLSAGPREGEPNRMGREQIRERSESIARARPHPGLPGKRRPFSQPADDFREFLVCPAQFQIVRICLHCLDANLEIPFKLPLVVKRHFLSVLLFGHNRAFDSDLSRLVVDDNIVRVRNRIRPSNTPTVILGEDTTETEHFRKDAQRALAGSCYRSKAKSRTFGPEAA